MNKVELDKNTRHLEDLTWALKARLRRPNGRDARDKVKVTRHWVVCTDGNRLHLTRNRFYIEPGLYEVIKQTKTQVTLLGTKGEFPEYKQAMKCRSMPAARIETRDFGGSKTGYGTSIGKVMRLGDELAINIDYLQDVLSADDHFRVSYWDNSQPVRFVNGTKIGLVMPLRS